MILFEALKKIDFTAVGSTNLLPLDIRNAIIRDKLSVLIFSALTSGSMNNEELLHSELHHPEMIYLQESYKNNWLQFTVRENKKQYGVSFDTPACLVFKEVPSGNKKMLTI